MQDEIDRTAEPTVSTSLGPEHARLEMLDASSAIALAERIVGSTLNRAAIGRETLEEAAKAAERGERAALVGPVDVFASQRRAMRSIAQARLGIVAHAIGGHGSEDLSALLDLGWGVLVAACPEDSFDLALVARRAAEDAGVPFLVLHTLGDRDAAVGRAVAMVGIPHESSCQAFVGPASRVRPRADLAHPSFAPLGDRAFAERVPFALGSALREYGTLSGRRSDVIDRSPLGEVPLVLVGTGPVGDALIQAAPELRARGYDVGAIHLCALRPFPAARLVKALSRALAITVLEPIDEPMSQGGAFSRELKAAFTDALTWVPGFPGIGRIPKLFVGSTGASFDVADLAAVCDNMLADERGRRSFSFAAIDDPLPRPSREVSSARVAAVEATQPIAIRWVLDDVDVADAALAATASVLSTTLGLRVAGIVAQTSADKGRDAKGAVVDVHASRDRARGAMARRSPRIVVATERGRSSSEAVATVAEGGIVVLVASSSNTETALPDAARAIVRERHVRVLPLPCGDEDPREVVAATCAGAALAAAARGKTALDVPLATRVIAARLADGGEGQNAKLAATLEERTRRVFDAVRDALHAQDAVRPGFVS